MQITLNQDEIETAIKDYVGNQIVIAEDMEISVDMKAGRGDNGYTATLDIRPAKTAKKKTVYRSTPQATEPAEEPKIARGATGKAANEVEEPKASEEIAVTKEESLEAMGGDAEVTSTQEENEPTTDEAVAEEPKPVETKKPGSIFNFAKTGTE